MSINQLAPPISSSSSCNLVSIRVSTGVNQLNFVSNFSHLSIERVSVPRKISTVIRMGCKKIYPGGVSRLKWQILQKEKARKLHEAGLIREKKVYQRRRKGELREAVSELERPWEVAERGSKLLINGGWSRECEEDDEVGRRETNVGVVRNVDGGEMSRDCRGTVEHGDLNGLITERGKFDTQERTDVRFVRRSGYGTYNGGKPDYPKASEFDSIGLGVRKL